MCSFYKGFPCNFFFYVEILCKFFPDFQTWNRIFFWFCKKNPTFSKIAHIYSLWTLFEPILSEKKKPFCLHSLSLSLTRTGAVGLGRFRLVHSRWSTAGEKLFFSYFFFLYIFSFFVFFCFFIRIKHSTCKTRGV